MPLCRKHHTEQGQCGWYKMAKRYTQIGFALFMRGWSFTESQKLINPKLYEE